MNRKQAGVKIAIILSSAVVFLMSACGPSAPISSGTQASRPTPTQARLAPTRTPESPATEETGPQVLSTDEPAPEKVSCVGLLTNEVTFYPIPGEALPGETLPPGAFVDVVGQLNEPTWYQVNLLNRIGWVSQAYVRLEDEDCRASQVGVVDALGLEGRTVFGDTFRDSQNWYYPDAPDRRPERRPNSVDNYLLDVDGYFSQVAITAPGLENVSAFNLVTLYWRQNGGDQSYVGVRYGNGSNFFEVHVRGDCNIDVLASNGYFETQATRIQGNVCKDESADVLYIMWDGEDRLGVIINDDFQQQPYWFNLGASMPSNGRIELIIDTARVQFDYVAVTMP